MKHFIISVLFAILCISSQAQETEIHTYKNKLGRKNVFTDEYVYETPMYGSITFYISSGYVRANDKAKSLYRFTSEPIQYDERTYKSVSWRCIDENNNDCIFTIMSMKDSDVRVISIMYNTISYVYYIG